jgi:hypothetical protein
MVQNTLKLSALAMFLLAAPVACGEAPEEEHENNHDHNNHDHENNHDHGDEEHVCVHFEAGPVVEVTAVADQAGTLPETFEEHHRIDVTMPAGEDTAYVLWTAEEAGEFAFWLGEDVPFALIDAGTELTPEEEGGAAEGCEDMAVAHKKFDVEAKAYTIKIGPATAGGTFQFAAEHAGEHDHSE